ncbi:hypothetical protein LOTGIDRAFT_140794 [Lottia gigantea]|uniref:Aminopeptidase n=1 Tax=Lottia gigantea TaxID=225164 RepID=V4CEL6_LOTGI|nr:hypothetical protein LOTGIDRAFT_140794 [Lottia gigantea]ESP00395.1 hypothetical protein LOTGIDRAFT_140794 [Lottia gigantea]
MYLNFQGTACAEANVSITTDSITHAPTTATPETIINYRLPSNTKPYHYNIDLQPNMYDDSPDKFTFNGSVMIWIKCLEESAEITLHVDRYEVNESSIVVSHLNDNENLYVRHTNDSVRQFLVLHLTKNMTAGENYTIYMTFAGPLIGGGAGLYLSSYTDNGKTIYLATTQFEAPHARKAFPCYDEPALKATFNTTLRHKLNTGRDYITEEGEYGVDVYSTTVIMPTYLLAFIICDYEYVEGISAKTQIPYRTYARPNAIQYANRSQEHGIKIFDKYESYFTPSYSLPKIDNIAIPDFNAGAMENWGLITYREGLLYYPGESEASTEKWIAEVISHEVAHQWFGNLVSPKWWKWLWLNEAFASFWDYHIVGEIYPSWRSVTIFNLNALEKHGIFVTDALRTSHPLTHDVESNTEIGSIFDGITYTKGSQIIRMMHFIMGQDLFIKALNNYLHAYQYSVAEHYDLFDKLTETAIAEGYPDLNMTKLMDPWVTQANYPVVNVAIEGGRYRLTQKRFLIGTTDQEAENDTALYDYKWPIPITYTTNKDQNFTEDRANVIMMNGNGDPEYINVDPSDTEWIILNLQQHGFYRVNYEESNWRALINQLKTDHTVISNINKAQIINDAANNAKAGLLDPLIALETLEYLVDETDYLPWRAFSREMNYVESMLLRTELYSSFSVSYIFFFCLLHAVLATTEHTGTGPDTIFAVTTLASYACNHDVSECVDNATSLFNEWMTSGTDNTNPNLRNIFYCTAVKEGRFAEWEFAYEEYKKSESTSKKNALRHALSCTTEVSLLHRYDELMLNMALDPDEVRSQDARTTIQYVASNPIGVDITWNFFKDKFSTLETSLGSMNSLSRLLSSVTETFNTQYYLDELQAMVDNKEVGNYESAFKGAIETTKANIEWLADNYEIYKTWLLS